MEKKRMLFGILRENRRGGKRLLKTVAFLGVFLAIFSQLQFILQAKWYDDVNTYARAKLFYQEDPAPDAVFIGPSHCYCGVNPVLIFKEYGISGYDFSVPSSGAEVTYLYVEEAIRTAKPKVIGIETSLIHTLMLYEDRSRQWLDPVPLSLDKMKIAKSLLDNNEKYRFGIKYDSLLSYAFPLLRYHDRWGELTHYDFMLDQLMPAYHGAVHYHGYGPRWGARLIEYQNYDDPWWYDDRLDDEAKIYFDKVVELCKENDVELFLLEIPTGDWHQGQHEFFSNWAAEYDLDYLDFNLLADEIELDVTTDFNNIGHVSDSGASKVSRYLGRYLKNAYGLPDHRGEEAYSKWETDWQVYQQDKKSVSLMRETDWSNYLSMLNDPNYTVYIAAKGDLGGAAHPELISKLQSLGLTKPLQGAGQLGYLAVIDRGNVVYEALEDEALSYDADVNGHSVAMKSAGSAKGNRVSIQLDHVERSVDQRGFCFVVYDNVLQDIVDKVTFDLYNNGAVYR